MKFKEWFMRSEIILAEGQAEDLVEKNPELKIAYDGGVVNPNYLRWLLKVKDHEPIQDVFPLLRSFEEKKNRLAKKDINLYKTPNELRSAIEELGVSKTQSERLLKEDETTRIGQFGDWLVVMPKTISSSCQYGKGTTWCTASTQSSNLFLNIILGPRTRIILYYLIKKNENPRENPDSKISLGYNNGKPELSGRDGGITVNAANVGMNETKLKEILKDQYEPIMNATLEHTKLLKNNHPLNTKMKEIIDSKNLEEFKNFFAGLTHEEFKYSIDGIISYSLPMDFIEFLIQKNGIAMDFATVHWFLAANPVKKTDISEKIIEYDTDLSTKTMATILVNVPYHVERIAKKLGPDNINKLSKDKQSVATILNHLIIQFDAPKNVITSTLGEVFIDGIDAKGILYLLKQCGTDLGCLKKTTNVLGTKNLEKLMPDIKSNMRSLLLPLSIDNWLAKTTNSDRYLVAKQNTENVLSLLRQYIPVGTPSDYIHEERIY
jgi:hypothetical protein